MLTKKECKKALDYFFDNSLIEDFANPTDLKNYYMLERLIEEHFELVDAMNHFSGEVMEYIEENHRLREN